MKYRVPSLAVAASACVLTIVSARAGDSDPAYAGTWAADLAQCKVGQERQEAPLVLTRDGYDQFETHCTFKSVDGGADGTWKVGSECTIEGSNEPYHFTLTVSGDTLTVGDDAGTRDLLKCP
ncbi:MAG: hypothetical protein AB7J30_08565 [Hyphomicrobium sp.]